MLNITTTTFCTLKHFFMKKIAFILLTALIISSDSFAQKLPPLDKSPADISYFRPDGGKSAPIIKIIYGRPQKNGRIMLGDKEPYGKVWRTGANESTEIKLYSDVTFGDKKLKAGTYTLYSIPNAAEWTIIFNSKLDTWGAYEYDESKDVARITIPVSKPDMEVEAFTITFEKKEGKTNMLLAWENTLVRVPFSY